jgi:DNA ligase-1
MDDEASNDSPVKVKARKKKAAVIDSDSDDDVKMSQNTCNEKSPSPEKKSRKSSPSPVSASSGSGGKKLASIFTTSKQQSSPKKSPVKLEKASPVKASPSPPKKPKTEQDSASPVSAATPSQPVKKNPFAGFFSPGGGKSAAKDGNSGGGGEGGSDYGSRVKKATYHPIEDAWWGRGEKTPYLALASTLLAIEETQGRLRTIEILANYFRSVMVQTPEELLPSIYLTLNRYLFLLETNSCTKCMLYRIDRSCLL